MLFDHDLFHFLFGFLGVLSSGLLFLIVVGFYQVEIASTKNFSTPEATNLSVERVLNHK